MNPKNVWCVIDCGKQTVESLHAAKELADKAQAAFKTEKPTALFIITTHDKAVEMIAEWAERDARFSLYN